jgi:tripartite-type tricarboxylate transporter receptor subunit TctC
LLEIVDTLREIAVSIDDFSDFPDVKSLAQQGIQSTKKVSWGGLVTPDDMSKEVVSRLEVTMQRVLRDPTVIERFKAVGVYPLYEDSKDLEQRIASDTILWKQMIAENKLRAYR